MHNNQLERLSANAEWIPVARSLSRLCNTWAKRRDLVVYLGADGGQGKASAFFDPGTAQIEVNSKDAFGDVPGTAVGDLTDRMELSKYPVAGGLSLHEAMHARYSTSDLSEVRKRLSSSAFSLFELLEELRVEGRGVLAFPLDAGYLRASTRTLLMEDGPENWSNRGTAVLLVGREHVGVLEKTDVLPLEAYLLRQDGWTVATLNRMREIISEFVLLDDSGEGLDRQIELAIELDSELPPDPFHVEDILEELVAGLLAAAERGAYRDVYESAEVAAAEADRMEREAAEGLARANRERADQVFRTSHGSPAGVPSQLRGARQPTSRERGAAVRLSLDLEKARYRDREVIDFDSPIPPGRLDGAEAMRLSAARWAGGDTSRYQPFTRRERFEVEEPKLTVGIMCDTSGSMTKVQPGIGVATYVISEAVYRIEDATAAQVYFGEDVKPGLRKGERLREVRTWSGGGAYEEFDRGFRALDGELDLLNGSGARLLFVASDGEFKEHGARNQVVLANRWIKACTDNGVAVVWLQLRGQNALKKFPGLEVVTVGDDVLDVTEAIGQACIRSLATVSGI